MSAITNTIDHKAMTVRTRLTDAVQYTTAMWPSHTAAISNLTTASEVAQNVLDALDCGDYETANNEAAMTLMWVQSAVAEAAYNDAPALVMTLVARYGEVTTLIALLDTVA